MTVKSILEAKGRDVVVIAPADTLSHAVEILAKYKIGAVVVCDETRHIKGILSERDVVRALSIRQAAALDMPVSEVMTAKVQMCREHYTVTQVMESMTQSRFRHMPVEEHGKLVGIISIGDVVKRRIGDVEREAEEILTYIATA
ncbi:CBS domain-containing protein [Brucella sp. BE17]|uniref:CBS domain-containing protein n=1 Tax=Brucella sp. BE17 TaxID=3142977 RepID=UPI0031BB8958